MLVNDVVDLFKNIANKHFLISSFDCVEQIEQQLNGNDVYPKLSLELPLNINSPTTNTKSYRIALLIMDMTLPDESNEITIVDKCVQIGFSIEEYLKKLDYNISNISYLTLHTIFNDETSGCRMEFDLLVRNPTNICQLPLE